MSLVLHLFFKRFFKFSFTITVCVCDTVYVFSNLTTGSRQSMKILHTVFFLFYLYGSLKILFMILQWVSNPNQLSVCFEASQWAGTIRRSAVQMLSSSLCSIYMFQRSPFIKAQPATAEFVKPLCPAVRKQSWGSYPQDKLLNVWNWINLGTEKGLC